MGCRHLRFATQLLVIVACMFTLPRSSYGEIPTAMTYEGSAVNAQGKPLTGPQDLKFAIYHSETGGTSLWMETHPKTHFNNGSFHVVLGRGNPAVPLNLPFDQQYYLGVTVGADPELVPRVPLESIPYSFRARVADRVPESSITTGNLAPGAVTDDKIKSVSWSKVVGVNGTPGVPSAVWSLKGNSGTDAAGDFMGTTDPQDLIFRTDNQPRFNIHSNGTADFLSDFAANGSFTSRPSQTSGSFLFGDGSVGINRPTLTSSLRLFGPSSGSFWMDGGNFGVGVAEPGSKLSVSGGLAVGSLYATMNAPADGAIILGRLGVGTGSPGEMLDVDGGTRLRSLLTVDGRTHITDPTSSSGPGSGALIVDGGAGIGGDTHVGRTLTVERDTRLDGELTVADSVHFVGPVEASTGIEMGSLLVTPGGGSIAGNLLLQSGLDVKGQSTFGDAGGSGPSYPVQVVGGQNGIEIRVSSNEPTNANNFVTFNDATGTRRGAIKGETTAEVDNDPYYVIERGFKWYEALVSDFELGYAVGEQIAAFTSSTACVGLGACATTPIPSLIIVAAAKLITAGIKTFKANAEVVKFETHRIENIGVTYSSGARDYAEWLPKANPAERFFPGDIVGVRGGLISRSIVGAEHLMVISTNPMVLGNVPAAGEEAAFEKVAFMGQVPVKVMGKVESGDHILALGDGLGVGRRQSEVTPADYLRFVGIAWSASKADGVHPVNVAVGLHSSDFARMAIQQDARLHAQSEEIRALREQIGQTHTLLARLVPGFKDAAGSAIAVSTSAERTVVGAWTASKPSLPGRVAPRGPASLPVADAPASPTTPCPAHSISRYDLEQGLATALETMRRSGATPQNDTFLREIEDPDYKERFLCALQAKFAQFAQSQR